MGGDNSDMEFQHDRSESMMNCPSTGMSTNPLSEKVAVMPMSSMPMYKNCSGGDPFFASGWDPIMSLNHSENFGGFANSAYPVGVGNHGISSSTSQLVQYQSSDSTLVDLVPKLSCFGSGSFSEMVNSFGLPEVGQTAKSICTQNYTLDKEGGSEKTSTNSPLSQEDLPISGNGAIEDSPNGKRRKRILDPHSAINPNKNSEVEQVKDMSEDSSGFQKEQDDKKSITELNPGSLRGKQSSKISKDNSPSGEGSKENYIHVRARRGQATNSHSLAERVRREKISERMRMLQELVPGCNKITGKAVMLDEIINYVQSLQQQVEFLSMKLATVNPEMSIDIERILSKDILQSRASNAAFLGIGSGMTSHPYPHGALQGTMPNIPNISPQFHHMPQNVWDNELRNLLQMGFNSNSMIDAIGLDGCSKPEM